MRKGPGIMEEKGEVGWKAAGLADMHLCGANVWVNYEGIHNAQPQLPLLSSQSFWALTLLQIMLLLCNHVKRGCRRQEFSVLPAMEKLHPHCSHRHGSMASTLTDNHAATSEVLHSR